MTLIYPDLKTMLAAMRAHAETVSQYVAGEYCRWPSWHQQRGEVIMPPSGAVGARTHCTEIDAFGRGRTRDREFDIGPIPKKSFLLRTAQGTIYTAAGIDSRSTILALANKLEASASAFGVRKARPTGPKAPAVGKGFSVANSIAADDPIGALAAIEGTGAVIFCPGEFGPHLYAIAHTTQGPDGDSWHIARRVGVRGANWRIMHARTGLSAGPAHRSSSEALAAFELACADTAAQGYAAAWIAAAAKADTYCQVGARAAWCAGDDLTGDARILAQRAAYEAAAAIERAVHGAPIEADLPSCMEKASEGAAVEKSEPADAAPDVAPTTIGTDGRPRRAPRAFEAQRLEFESRGHRWEITVARYWLIDSVRLADDPDLLTWRAQKLGAYGLWDHVPSDRVPLAVARRAAAFCAEMTAADSAREEVAPAKPLAATPQDDGDFARRVSFVSSIIGRGRATSREFDSCFERWDGDAVSVAVMRRAQHSPGSMLASSIWRYLDRGMADEAASRQPSGMTLGQWSRALIAQAVAARPALPEPPAEAQLSAVDAPLDVIADAVARPIPAGRAIEVDLADIKPAERIALFGADPLPHDMPPTESSARYARGKSAVRCPSRDQFKSRAARLAEALGGRWSHRDKAYIMSPRAAQRVREHWNAGYDADIFPAPGRSRPALTGPAVAAG